MSNAVKGVGKRCCTLAEEHIGVEHGFELLLDQPRLSSAGLLVMAEEARESFGAVAMASPRSFKLVGLEHAMRRSTLDGSRGMCWAFDVAFDHLLLEDR